MAFQNLFHQKYLRFADFIICTPFLLVPFFISFPYRVNIFLSWEGAYRLSIGQIPYKDFGLPMGIGYWLIPAFFFKIFGPSMLTLIKSQFLINLMSILSLRGILYNLRVNPIIVSLALLVFCLTYVINNFWPWYNHAVVVFELVAIFFLTRSFGAVKSRMKYALLIASAFFTVVSFFTKQDVGALCFLICFFLLLYETVLSSGRTLIAVYLVSVALMCIVAIIPFVQYDFFYWFNYGQFPHNPRVSFPLLLNTFLAGSQEEKIYLAAITVAIALSGSFREFLANRNFFMLAVISVMMIAQAILTRVTSPLPTDHMTYYHVFGFIMLISFIPWNKWSATLWPAIAICVCIVVLYSGGYWKYLSAFFNFKTENRTLAAGAMKEGGGWQHSKYETLRGISMPVSTIRGIDSIMKIPGIRKEGLKVLNMSELTTLAKELNYEPITGHPLWYHVNIGMFQKEIDKIKTNVANRYYDVVLFEDIPSLTEFYPYQVRDHLKLYYSPYCKFLAPRKLEDSTIEVYIKE